MKNAKKTTVGRNDIELCFKGLGLSYDATPDQVEKAYAAFMERCSRGLKSADPNKVQRTKEDMDLMADLYYRIKKSVTYQDRVRQSSSSGGLSGKQLALALAGLVAVVAIVVFFLR